MWGCPPVLWRKLSLVYHIGKVKSILEKRKGYLSVDGFKKCLLAGGGFTQMDFFTKMENQGDAVPCDPCKGAAL